MTAAMKINGKRVLSKEHKRKLAEGRRKALERKRNGEKITPSIKSTTRTLHCELGDHDWEAPRKRGAGPKNCPEHRPTPAINLDKMQDGRRIKGQVEREKKIREIIEGRSCRCGIEPNMNDTELRALYPGCCDPWHICSVLDTVMRSVYTYE